MSAIKSFVCVFICICMSHGTHGQSYFDILPDVGGLDMQAGATVVYMADSVFYVAGHRYDTSYAGSDAKPWLASFNFEGSMDTVFSLRDPGYDRSFNRHYLLFDWKNDSNLYGYSVRVIDGFSTPYIYEFNTRVGEFVRSKHLINTELGLENIASSKIFYRDSVISLLSYDQDPDSVRLYITELDTSFGVIREFRVEPAASKQFPAYFRRLLSGEYEIVSSARLYQSAFTQHYMKIGATGKIIKSSWLPSDTSVSNLLSFSKNVIRTSSGDWLFMGYNNIYGSDSCLTCIGSIPYVGRVNPTFDSVYWLTRFYGIPFTFNARYHMYTLAEVEDGCIGVGEFLAGSLEDYSNSAIILKVGQNGDSLWMKQIIPLGWDHERFLFGQLTDISTNPFGSIIAVGEVADNDFQIYRPWILHLDKDGCLVPGCNLVSGFDTPDPDQPTGNAFRIYPNPVQDDLYLLCFNCLEAKYQLQLFSTDGTSLGSTALTGNKGAQYTLPVDHLHAGSYHLVIRSVEAGTLETHTFVKP